MTDRELMQQCYAVPLHEQLTSVPENSRLVIDDPDGKGALFIPVGRMCHEAAAALRERLAQPEREPVCAHDIPKIKCSFCHVEYKQPEQEPVAWVDESAIRWLADRKGKTSAHCTTQLSAARSFEKPMPIYTAPPRREWVGLTDEELEAVDKTIDKFVPLSDGKRLYARAIEAKLKEKNT